MNIVSIISICIAVASLLYTVLKEIRANTKTSVSDITSVTIKLESIRDAISDIKSLIVYTIAQVIIMLKTGQEMSTLTTCFFAAFGGEFMLCALIKIFKIKSKGESSDE